MSRPLFSLEAPVVHVDGGNGDCGPWSMHAVRFFFDRALTLDVNQRI